MYEIARRSTIPSDNVGHKVSVAIIDLKPTFEYESVPKKATNAYLKARVKNTSPYALLAGPTNVFLDNNFISKVLTADTTKKIMNRYYDMGSINMFFYQI